jgi:dCTP deaminase
MILSDKEVKREIKIGNIGIDPLEKKNVMSIGIDMKLGNKFKFFNGKKNSIIDSKINSFEKFTETKTVENGQYIIIKPKEFLLGVTKETIELSNSLAGRIDGRSSLGRLGISVHITAGKVDPGFKGKLTLEICNMGTHSVALYPGMKFCTVIFERVSSEVEKSYEKYGKYQGDNEPKESKIDEEFNGG